jgi:hypothetical protein
MNVVFVGAFEDGSTIGAARELKVFSQSRTANSLRKSNVVRIVQTVDHRAIPSVEATPGTSGCFTQSSFPTDQQGVWGHGAQRHTWLASGSFGCDQAFGLVKAPGLPSRCSAATGALSGAHKDPLGAQLKVVSLTLDPAFGFAFGYGLGWLVLLTSRAWNKQCTGGEDDDRRHQVSWGKANHVIVICHTRGGCST